jgi:hypothetical protein
MDHRIYQRLIFVAASGRGHFSRVADVAFESRAGHFDSYASMTEECPHKCVVRLAEHLFLKTGQYGASMLAIKNYSQQ